MSDQQFNRIVDWFGTCFSNFFGFLDTQFDAMTGTHWFILCVITVVVGFMCLRGLRAGERV